MSASLVDWEARPRTVRRTPAGVAIRDIGINPTGGQWTFTPAVPDQLITADFYNSTQQNIINNFMPIKMDDYSSTIAEMQAETDPYPGNAAYQATSLAGELERLRYVIHRLNPTAPAWYAVGALGLSPTTLVLPNNVYYQGLQTDGTTKDNLIGVSSDNNVYIAPGTNPRNVLIGADGGTTIIQGHFILRNNKPLHSFLADNTTWQQLIVCSADNSVQIAYGLPGDKPLRLHGWTTEFYTGKLMVGAGFAAGATTHIEIAAHEDSYPYLVFHRRNTKAWTFGLHTDNRLVFGDGWGLGAVKFWLNTEGSVGIPEGQWYYGGNHPLIAKSGDQTLVGGYHGSIYLTVPTNVGQLAATNISVGSNLQVNGSATINGTLNAGAVNVGGAPVVGPNLVRAFGRGHTAGGLSTNYNITNWIRQGVGIVDVYWTPALGQPCVVATCEGGPKVFCTATVMSGQAARIEIWTDGGARYDYSVSVMICGQ